VSFYVVITLIAFAVSFGLALVLWRLGIKHRWHREIRPRDVHKEPTPRLGGIAVFVGMATAAVIASPFEAFAGVFDDPPSSPGKSSLLAWWRGRGSRLSRCPLAA
jgi:UDP-GlcNAc:undecaprenyl-phosphate GlcNAc-1-phosphate transferase